MAAPSVHQNTFLRNTPALMKEFEPQHKRMQKRLMPLLFTLFHFFETYRNLHVQHLMEGGITLNRQVYTLNPLEVQVMSKYDDFTLLKAHSIWTLNVM
jgi:hypothetical protein